MLVMAGMICHQLTPALLPGVLPDSGVQLSKSRMLSGKKRVVVGVKLKENICRHAITIRVSTVGLRCTALYPGSVCSAVVELHCMLNAKYVCNSYMAL